MEQVKPERVARILGIDPGYGRMGWSILDKYDGHQELVAYGCVETTPADPIEQRLLIIHRRLTTVIKEYLPSVAAIEALFFSNNAKTAMKVSEARGVIVLALTQNDIPIVAYTPGQIKRSVTGNGKGSKDEVHDGVNSILSITTRIKPDDTVDAIAAALTHSITISNPEANHLKTCS